MPGPSTKTFTHFGLKLGSIKSNISELLTHVESQILKANIEIVEFTSEHLAGAVAALLRVRESDSTYPPQQDAEATVESFSEWLLNAPVLQRWVALVDGVVAGHVLLTPAHEYLTDFLDTKKYPTTHERGFAEIAKFFVSPDFQGHGLGDLLFRTACAVSEDLLMQPGLAVVSTSEKAVRFYAHHGMHKIGSFHGIHGVNHVFMQEFTVKRPEPVQEKVSIGY